MNLINATPFVAHLFRTFLTDTEVVATVVAKATYRLEDGALAVAHGQHPVGVGPYEIDGVSFPPDAGYGKEGVDVLVVGHAYASSPTVATLAGLSIDDHDCTLAVIGDRRWERRWSGWTHTDAEPFEAMPLDWSRAFGGYASVRGTEVPIVDNMVGRGFVLDLDVAEGVLLPNLEAPTDRIEHPHDHPDPVSFAPLPPGNRHATNAAKDVGEHGEGLSKAIYNVAIPPHRLPTYRAGAEVRLHNLTPRPARPFALPGDRVAAEVTFDTAEHTVEGRVDTLLFRPDRGEFVVTHRLVFRYPFVPTQRRGLRLVRVA